LFSTKEFIDASRSFVCIRIETYENKESQERVRSLLNGRLANTAFCMFDPEGRRQLTRAGRSPNQVIAGTGGKGAEENDAIIDQMCYTALRFREKGAARDMVLPDFLSFGQALNVASADQRLLVFVNADDAALEKLSPTLREVFSDDEIIGRFHLDLAGEYDAQWTKSIRGSTSQPAIHIIRGGKFGMDGAVVNQLPLDSSLEEIKTTLLAENKKFNLTEQRKDYASHVMEGKRKGIEFESKIPYGEDLDGDGEIDQRRRRGGGKNGGAEFQRRRGFGRTR
jgi:hypothetical protein